MIKVTPEIEAKEKRYEEKIKQLSLLEYPFSILKIATGMSYRQINDWDSKGYFKAKRASNKHWRKFTIIEIFSLIVASELVNLGIKASHTKWIIQELQKPEYVETALFFYYAGIRTYLVTDLKSGLFLDMWHNISFFPKEQSISINICAKPLIDKLNIATSSQIVPIYKELDAQTFDENSYEERSILNAVKNKDYQEVIIKKAKDRLKVKGISYLDKDISNEIAGKKLRKRKHKVITHIDENGKITNAQIEEDLSY